jgi:hypothetical protein
MSCLVAVLPAKIRARWDRIALEQLAERAAELADHVDCLNSEVTRVERRADYWEEQVRRAQDEGAHFAMTQDGQLYRLQSAEA